MYRNDEEVMARVHEHLENVIEKDYEWVMIALAGSQNYNLHYEYSDVDTKVIVLPKFDDFCLGKNKAVSTTTILENDEHIDLKDVRPMFDCFRKQNLNFVEILFSNYMIVNPKYEAIFQPMLDNKEEIAHYNNYATVNCLAGMSMEKYKALEHPYPGTIDKIEKFGYDPKQLHHILRIEEFIKRYIKGERYQSCLNSHQKDYLLEIKKGCLSLEEARKKALKSCDKIYDIKKDYMNTIPLQVNKEVLKVMDNVTLGLIKTNFISEFAK